MKIVPVEAEGCAHCTWLSTLRAGGHNHYLRTSGFGVPKISLPSSVLQKAGVNRAWQRILTGDYPGQCHCKNEYHVQLQMKIHQASGLDQFYFCILYAQRKPVLSSHHAKSLSKQLLCFPNQMKPSSCFLLSFPALQSDWLILQSWLGIGWTLSPTELVPIFLPLATRDIYSHKTPGLGSYYLQVPRTHFLELNLSWKSVWKIPVHPHKSSLWSFRYTLLAPPFVNNPYI